MTPPHFPSSLKQARLDEFRERTGLDCVFTSSPKNTLLDPDRATTLFRISQEALTNVARHAEATRVVNPDSLTVWIQDNGRGITEADMEKTKSFGLLGCVSAFIYSGARLTSMAFPARAQRSPFGFRSKRNWGHDQSPDRR